MSRRISIGRELAKISDAIDAARLLADELDTEQFARDEDYRRAPTMIEAVLSLAVARVELLQRALNGTIDPRWLATQYNRPLPPTDDPEQQDVVLEPWAPKRRVEVAKIEVRRAKKAEGAQ